MRKNLSCFRCELCCLASVAFLGVGRRSVAADEPSSVAELITAVEKHHTEGRPREACAYAEKLHVELARQVIEQGVEDISRDLSSGTIDGVSQHEAYKDIMAVDRCIAIRLLMHYWQSIKDETDPAGMHTRLTVVIIMTDFWDRRTMSFFVPLLDSRERWRSAVWALQLMSDQSFGFNSIMTPEQEVEARNKARSWALRELRLMRATGRDPVEGGRRRATTRGTQATNREQLTEDGH